MSAPTAAPPQTATTGVPTRPPRPRWRRRRYAVLAVLLGLLAVVLVVSPGARLGARTLLALPRLAIVLGGFGGPSAFLLIGQNADEPRPTGGFMGSLGLAVVENGGLRSFDYRNSSEFEDPRAPRVLAPTPLERYAGLGGWLLRDANWSPDFPSTMAQIDWFWRRDQSTPLDGALAFTEEALVVLLRATGPVTLADGASVDAEGARTWILRQLYPLGADGRPTYEVGAKTRALSDLAEAVLARLSRPGLSDLGRYGAAVRQLVRERHIALWFRDPTLQGLAAAWGVDGRLRAVEGDSLMIVDTSVTLNKVGRYVATSYAYRAEPRPSERIVRARLTVTYDNNYRPSEARRLYPAFYLSRVYDPRGDRFIDVEGLWATWLRAFVPAGAVLRGATGLDAPPSVEDEVGLRSFGAYVPIGVGERRRVTIEYDLPDRDPAGVYSLFVQKQPGMLRAYEIEVVLPPGAPAEASPGAVREGDTLRWTGQQSTDLELRVRYGG